MSHPNVQDEVFQQIVKQMQPSMFLSGNTGVTDVNPSWNKRFPDMHFTQIGELLYKVWGKSNA